MFGNEVHVNTTTTAYVTIQTGGNDEVKRKKVNMAFDTFVVFKSQHNKDVINLQKCGCH